jgi:hypothetical protein
MMSTANGTVQGYRDRLTSAMDGRLLEVFGVDAVSDTAAHAAHAGQQF